MKKTILLAALGISVVTVGVAVACYASKNDSTVLAQSPGSETDNNNKTPLDKLRSSSSRTIFFVFAEWCGYCRRHKEKVHDAMKRWASKNGVEVVDVDYEDKDNKELVMEITKRSSTGQIAFPHFHLVDGSSQLSESGYVEDALRFKSFFDAV